MRRGSKILMAELVFLLIVIVSILFGLYKISKEEVQFAPGDVYYVRPNGGSYGLEDGSSYNDAWSGFSSINWSTIEPENTLYICGEHNEQLIIRKSGTADENIIINGNCPGDNGLINLSNIASLKTSGNDYIEISGLTLKGGIGNIATLEIEADSVGVTINNCIIRAGPDARGIRIWSGSNDFRLLNSIIFGDSVIDSRNLVHFYLASDTIINNTLINNSEIYGTSTYNCIDSSVGNSASLTNLMISGNTIHHCEEGIRLSAGSGAITNVNISGNMFYRNGYNVGDTDIRIWFGDNSTCHTFDIAENTHLGHQNDPYNTSSNMGRANGVVLTPLSTTKVVYASNIVVRDNAFTNQGSVSIIISGCDDSVAPCRIERNTIQRSGVEKVFKGTHTGSDNSAVLEDSNSPWSLNDNLLGWSIRNLDQLGESSYITSYNETTLTATLNSGDWDNGDRYAIGSFRVNSIRFGAVINGIIQDNDVSYTFSSAGDGNAIIVDQGIIDKSVGNNLVSKGCIVRRNIIHDNNYVGGGGISVFCAENTEVYNNIAYNNKDGFRTGGNNILSSNNTFFYNNIAYNNSKGLHTRVYGGFATAKNNIFYNNDHGIYIDSDGEIPLAEYNDFFNSTLENKFDVSSGTISLATGEIISDPLFINPLDPDGPDNIMWTSDDGFRLRAGSPAIGAASDGGDIGAYEYSPQTLPPDAYTKTHYIYLNQNYPEQIFSGNTLVGVGNYSLGGNELNSEFIWYKNSVPYKTGKSRSLFSMESNNSNFIDDIGNHDGTNPTLNCEDAKEGKCCMDLGLNSSKSLTFNNSEYYIKLANIYGQSLDLTTYTHISFWIYIENTEILKETRSFRLYLSSNDLWYRGGFEVSSNKDELTNGWNYFSVRLEDMNPLSCSLYPESCNISEIKFVVFTFEPLSNTLNIPQGNLKIDEIKVWENSSKLKEGSFTFGDEYYLSYKDCNSTFCENWKNSQEFVILNTPPVYIGQPRLINEQFEDSTLECIDRDLNYNKNTYYDGDGEELEITHYHWFRNEELIETETSKLINLSQNSFIAGDEIYCSVQFENSHGISDWYNSNKVIINSYPKIKIDVSSELNSISRGIFGQGLELSGSGIASNVLWNKTSHNFIQDQLEVAKEIGFTEVRIGGCNSNWFIWDKCKNWTNEETYYTKTCGTDEYSFQNCTDGPGIQGVYDYVKAIGAKDLVIAVNLVNNGSNNTPIVRTTPDYNAEFVNWTNNQMKMNVTYWEMGNEVYGSSQWGETANATQYGQIAIEHCNAMKRVDPSIKCGIVVHGPYDWWIPELLNTAGNFTDFIVEHDYYGSPEQGFISTTVTNSLSWEDYSIYSGNYTFSIGAMAENTPNMTMFIDGNKVGEFVISNYNRNGDYKIFTSNPIELSRGKHIFAIKRAPRTELPNGGGLYLGNLSYDVKLNSGEIMHKFLNIKDEENDIYYVMSSDAQIGYFHNKINEYVEDIVNHSMEIIVTEHLCHTNIRSYPKWSTPSTRWWSCDGISNALRYQQFMRDNIQKAHAWITVSASPRPSSYYDTNDYRKLPQFYTHQMFSRNTGEILVNTNIENTLLFNNTNKYYGTFNDIPFLSITSSKSADEKYLYVNVVNRHQYSDIPAVIEISEKKVSSTAKVYKLESPSLDSNNEFGEIIFTKEETIPASNYMEYVFPKYSIHTLIFELTDEPAPTPTAHSSSSSSSDGNYLSNKTQKTNEQNFISNIYKLTSEQFSEGYTMNLSVNERVEFPLEGLVYNIDIKEIGKDYFKVDFGAEEYYLSLEKTKKFDLNKDGYYDASIKLKEISAEKASVTIKGIYEKVLDENIPMSKSKINWILLSVISFTIILIGVIVRIISWKINKEITYIDLVKKK